MSRTLAAAALLLAAVPAEAAGDAQMGRVIAQNWCISCHGTTDAVPTLPEAVNRPGRTGATLRAWLTEPHPPMPNLSLARQEIDDLVAYLETLQTRR